MPGKPYQSKLIEYEDFIRYFLKYPQNAGLICGDDKYSVNLIE